MRALAWLSLLMPLVEFVVSGRLMHESLMQVSQQKRRPLTMEDHINLQIFYGSGIIIR